MTQEEKIIELFKGSLFLRSRDLVEHGLPRTALSRLHHKGQVIRTERGLYMRPGEIETEHISLLEVAKRVPRGVFCLLTALFFHGIGTQNPFQVWIAIDRKAAAPKKTNVGLRIFRFSEASIQYGVEEHDILGVTIKVTSPAKTIADCFKFRNKVGLDVAIEALREGIRDRRFTMDDLYLAAKVCRIWNVMRPYAEAMV
jgi:predicted transcriptional regulator of viral defense system